LDAMGADAAHIIHWTAGSNRASELKRAHYHLLIEGDRKRHSDHDLNQPRGNHDADISALLVILILTLVTALFKQLQKHGLDIEATHRAALQAALTNAAMLAIARRWNGCRWPNGRRLHSQFLSLTP
jgi:hypothetical protein